jgi:hypothetical protein
MFRSPNEKSFPFNKIIKKLREGEGGRRSLNEKQAKEKKKEHENRKKKEALLS